jgi:hypothetical protein
VHHTFLLYSLKKIYRRRGGEVGEICLGRGKSGERGGGREI